MTIAGVTAVVVTHNSGDVVGSCLAAIPAAMTGIERWQVVVVDNASDDDTLAVVAAADTAARVVRIEANLGYAAGVNAGAAAAATDDALLVLNPDVQLAPGSVAALVAALDRPGTGIAVPRIEGLDGALHHSLRRAPTVRRALGEALLGGERAGRSPTWGEVVRDDAVYEHPATADWATGAVWLVSAECRTAVGAWDESFFLYSEETDYALRARDAGYTLRYAPAARAVHRGGDSGTSPFLWSILTVNRTRFFRRRHGVVASAAFTAAVILNEALRAARGSGTHRAALAALLRPAARPAELDRPTAPGYVCFSAQDFWYHNRAHSDFQLMRRIAERRPVVFVNSIGMRMPLPGRSTKPWRRVLRKARSMAKAVRRPLPELPNLTVMTPLVLPLYGNATARALNALLVRAQVTAVARARGIREPVVVATIPTAWDVVKGMRRRALVVNRSDKYSAFGEADQAVMRQLEEELLRTADRVVYASRGLLDDEASLTGPRAHFLDHGVDLDHFSLEDERPEPPALAAIRRPRVGFFGGLDDYVIDFDLLERLARELPEVSVVLIGDATCSMDRLTASPNVHWLGFQPYEDIPAYGRGFDVAIMPWLRNEWIRHCNPIKVKEYLALGLPVVSTWFPEVVRYAETVHVAQSHEEFLALVRKAVADRDGVDRTARRAAVADDSWDRKAEQLMSLAEEVA